MEKGKRLKELYQPDLLLVKVFWQMPPIPLLQQVGGGCEWLWGTIHSIHNKNRKEVKRDHRTEGTCMEQLTTVLLGTAEMTDCLRDQLVVTIGNLTGNLLPNEGPRVVPATLT